MTPHPHASKARSGQGGGSTGHDPGLTAEQLLDSVPDEVVVLDRDGRLRYVNRAAMHAARHAREEMVGRTVGEVFPERATLERECRRAIDQNVAVRVEEHDPVLDTWLEHAIAPSADGVTVCSRDITERRHGERRQAYEAHVLEYVHDAIIATDERLVVTAWNRAAETIYGWTGSEAIGHDVREVVQSELGADRRHELMRKVRASGYHAAKMIHHRRDGAPIHVEGVVGALRDAAGQVTGYVAVHRDITASELAAEQAAKREAQLRYAQQLARVGSWEWDIATDRVTWSDELYRIWGVDPQRFEWTYHAIRQLIHADDRPAFDEVVERTRHTHEPYVFEHRIVRPDGTVRVLQSRGAVVVDSAGHVIGMLGTGQDITERMLADEALRRAHDELEQRVAERTGEVTTANEELRMEVAERERAEVALVRMKDELAADLHAMIRLHEFSSRLATVDSPQSVLEEVLDASIELQRADFGSVQLYNPEKKTLEIVAQRGFSEECLDHFKALGGDSAARARAMHRGERAIIEDVEAESNFEPHRHAAAMAGFRALQSTPLFSRRGELLGMLSTHFRDPHRPSDRELRMTDLYALQGVATLERRRVEERLRRSDAHLTEGQKLTRTGSWGWNISSGEVHWSQEQFRIFDLDPEGGPPSFERSMGLIHPDDRLFVQETLEEVRLQTVGSEWDSRIVTATGVVKDVHMTAHPVFESGTLTELVGTTMDISERKRAEEATREANDKIRMILDSITDQFFALSKDWRFTYLNRNAAEQLRRLGKDPARLIGSVLWDEFPNVPNEEALRRVMTERVPVTDELHYAPLSEWVENHMYPSRDGGLVSFQKYITERKRAEAQLRRSEAYLTEAQRLTHCGSWAWNVSTGALFWSKEHFSIFSLDGEGATPTLEEFFEMIHSEDRPSVRRIFETAVRQRTGCELDFRIVRPDGSIGYIHSSSHPVLNEFGELTEYVGAVIDVTQRKQAAEEQTQLRRRIVHAQEDERRRISREMHDQFGQLSALTLKLAALKDTYRDQLQLRDQLQALEGIARQLDADADSIVWQLRPTALDDHGLEAALSNHANRWSEHFDVRVELQMSGIERRHTTDEIATTLYRVVQEALNNIGKHARAKNVAILLEGRRDHVSLIVEDDGVGFDAEQAFGPDQKRLGLLGVRERIMLVGGMVDIESAAGKGTTIVVRIPAEPGSVPAG